MSADGRWRKSSRCNSGFCAEVRTNADGSVSLRNNTQPDVVITFDADEWDAFTAGVRDGEFNTPIWETTT